MIDWVRCAAPGCTTLITGDKGTPYCWPHHVAALPGDAARRPREGVRGGRGGEPWSRSGWTDRAYAVVRQVGRCQRCGSTKGLVAHHVRFTPGKAGVVDASSPLEVLCSSCHQSLHRRAEHDARRAAKRRS